MTRRAIRAWPALLLAAMPMAVVLADTPSQAPAIAGSATVEVRNGRDIYARFREGLADPTCDADASQRWQRHFANAPVRLASRESDALPLFGYVVEALRDADLPTEYALIPFVESGYRPGASSRSGPAGLWQFIALTARDHGVPVRPGYDGRLSPVDSTRAAVRYLKTLHGMFAGDWRLAVMAYNAGEYRVLGALKRSGQQAARAQPEKLVGLSDITQAYVHKLHALACVLDRADDGEQWQHALDRPVAVLRPVELPKGVASLDDWADRLGLDTAILRRINPALTNGRIAASARIGRSLRVLAPALPDGAKDRPVFAVSGASVAPSFSGSAVITSGPAEGTTTLADASEVIAYDNGSKSCEGEHGGDQTGCDAPATAPTEPAPSPASRAHTVVRGDSLSRIAHHYGVSIDALRERNHLAPDRMLQPGMVLKIDPPID